MSDSMNQMHTTQKSLGCKVDVFETGYTADAVEWCPTDGCRSFLLCATYQLHKAETSAQSSDENSEDTDTTILSSSAKRVGKLLLLNVCRKLNDSSGGLSTQFFEQHSVEVAGVLDIKWCHGISGLDHGPPLFGAVDSSGDLSLWSLNSAENAVAEIQLVEVLSTDDNDALALSLDWSTAIFQSEPKIVVSNSAGVLTLVDVTNTGLVPANQWKAHDFEAWITAFNYHDTNIVYSGGDDCLLKVWDVRTSLDSAVCSRSLYDEHIMIWDSRQLRQPIADVVVGGGVWRIKWDPFNGKHLLAACMHNGSHIVDCSGIDEGASPTVVASYMEHQSLVYGADWCRSSEADLPLLDSESMSSGTRSCTSCDCDASCSSAKNPRLISSCSFYDCQAHLWTVTLE